MNRKYNGHTINVVFVLAVACAFAASVLMVLMLGVRVYADIEATATAEFKERVCLSYLTTKVHRSDTADCVRVGDFEGIPALYIDEQIDGVEYNTIIYSYDGWLRELFSEKDLSLSADAGTAILEVDSISFRMAAPDLIAIEYSDKSGNSGSSFVNLRSGEGGQL